MTKEQKVMSQALLVLLGTVIEVLKINKQVSMALLEEASDLKKTHPEVAKKLESFAFGIDKSSKNIAPVLRLKARRKSSKDPKKD